MKEKTQNALRACYKAGHGEGPRVREILPEKATT